MYVVVGFCGTPKNWVNHCSCKRDDSYFVLFRNPSSFTNQIINEHIFFRSTHASKFETAKYVSQNVWSFFDLTFIVYYFQRVPIIWQTAHFSRSFPWCVANEDFSRMSKIKIWVNITNIMIYSIICQITERVAVLKRILVQR